MVLKIKNKAQNRKKKKSKATLPLRKQFPCVKLGSISVKSPTNLTKFFKMLRNLGLLLCNDKA